MVRSKDGSRLTGSSHRKNKFNQGINTRGGKKRYGSRLDKKVIPSEKLIRTSNQQFNSHSHSGTENDSSKRERTNSDGSESSNSEDLFLQLVSAVSDSKHKNVSIISDESDLEDIADKSLATDVYESENSNEESEFEDDHSDISVSDQENNIVHSDKEDAEDPFNIHFQHDLSDDMFEAVSSRPTKVEEYTKTWPNLGNLKIILPKIPECSTSKIKSNSSVSIEETKSFAKSGNVPTLISNIDWSKLHLKSQIQSNILTANIRYNESSSLTEDEPLSELQKEIFSVVNSYQDFYYTNRTLDNSELIRFIYSLHAVNHALKTRLKIIHHNTRLSNRNDSETDIPDEFRDQGLTRPKVLILVPFRDSAFRIIEMMITILNLEKSGNVIKKKRFLEEFTGEEIAMPVKNRKPEDYERTFKGNTDDTFRIGVSVTKKSLKLYADFYSADIIIASPLGLRVIVGAEGEPERDFDFLASIEVLILDQTEIFLMQNWDHLLHVLDHLHLQPKNSHGTNFARVRTWALSGWSQYYRQTLVFAAHPLPQISSLVNRKCHNYRGKVCVINRTITGSICQVVLQLPQVFHKLEVQSAVQCLDKRFEIFINKILPQYKESLMSHTLIYVPSYFDYVRLRNYFKKETISFTQICEYSKENKIARARDMFFHSDAHFMLYSERFHFFRRIHLKGIRHILFYQPPTFPHFYSEMCNFVQDLKKKSDAGGEMNMSVSVLYSKFDAPQLAAIVGSERAARMLASDRPVHMFMTGE